MLGNKWLWGPGPDIPGWCRPGRAALLEGTRGVCRSAWPGPQPQSPGGAELQREPMEGMHFSRKHLGLRIKKASPSWLGQPRSTLTSPPGPLLEDLRFSGGLILVMNFRSGSV